MLHKTRAISLSYIRFKETSIIARIFTEQFGLQGFVVNGVRASKSRLSPALFQPLHLVDLIQYHDEKKDLHRLSEIKTAFPLKSIPVHHVKSAMSMFAAELLSRVVKDGQSNSALFELVWKWTTDLDELETGFEYNHIQLSWQMLGPLGIAPENWRTIFVSALRPGDLNFAEVAPFFDWLEGGVKTGTTPNVLRQLSLDMIIHYMQTHMEGMGNIKSLQVLRSVFAT